MHVFVCVFQMLNNTLSIRRWSILYVDRAHINRARQTCHLTRQTGVFRIRRRRSMPFYTMAA